MNRPDPPVEGAPPFPEGDVALPAVASFAVYLDDGRLQLQLRGYRSPEGEPVVDAGLYSINGGSLESPDLAAELAREIAEELGIPIDPGEIARRTRYLGAIRDETAGRTNHVFRLTESYESLLARLPPRDAIAALLNPEGLGRAAVSADDLARIIAEGRLTGISRLMLDRIPSLWPR
jgi:8-oxo-dGTP pyrophosphatase MutT (NUDIX family)